jgi:hypothetical protein
VREVIANVSWLFDAEPASASRMANPVPRHAFAPQIGVLRTGAEPGGDELVLELSACGTAPVEGEQKHHETADRHGLAGRERRDRGTIEEETRAREAPCSARQRRHEDPMKVASVPPEEACRRAKTLVFGLTHPLQALRQS